MNAWISAQGVYFIFLSQEGRANSEGGACLKGGPALQVAPVEQGSPAVVLLRRAGAGAESEESERGR